MRVLHSFCAWTLSLPILLKHWLPRHLVSAFEMCHMHSGAVWSFVQSTRLPNFLLTFPLLPIQSRCRPHTHTHTHPCQTLCALYALTERRRRRRRIAQMHPNKSLKHLSAAVRSANTENGTKTEKEISHWIKWNTVSVYSSFWVFAIFGCLRNSVGTGRMPKRASFTNTASKCNSQRAHTQRQYGAFIRLFVVVVRVSLGCALPSHWKTKL